MNYQTIENRIKEQAHTQNKHWIHGYIWALEDAGIITHEQAVDLWGIYCDESWHVPAEVVFGNYMKG